jgi:hypothetical protein
MSPFFVTLGYLVLHLSAYRFLLRTRWRVLQTEKGIFGYHAVSFAVAFTAVSVALLAKSELNFDWLVFTIGAHGVYSLSFLELWSLTQGSYSLSLLAAVDRLGGEATDVRLQELSEIGRGKTNARTSDLARLGLMRPDGATLTLAGTIAARFFRCLLFLTKGQPLNR